jgi:hypothetical protein
MLLSLSKLDELDYLLITKIQPFRIINFFTQSEKRLSIPFYVIHVDPVN